jgi:hypothetical protein
MQGQNAGACWLALAGRRVGRHLFRVNGWRRRYDPGALSSKMLQDTMGDVGVTMTLDPRSLT